jgi:nicotinate-nucleotide pyrophosphorylase (carboxylating)
MSTPSRERAVSGFDPPAHAVREAVGRALAEDLGPLGDLTASLVPRNTPGFFQIVARAPGVLAGTACVDEVFVQLRPAVAAVHWEVRDGAVLAPGAVIGRVSGQLAVILTGERTALNFLCHLSGVATATRAFVGAVEGTGARVWDTRKTLPGLRALEKAAVRAGGGVNHRGNLSELVLVKDNHLAGLSIGDAVARARSEWPARTVEVECDTLDQVEEAVVAGASMVLLDNMTPADVRAAVDRVRASSPAVLVEVSGGVTLANARAYAEAGADLISTSTITQSAPALDLGLDAVDAHAVPVLSLEEEEA